MTISEDDSEWLTLRTRVRTIVTNSDSAVWLLMNSIWYLKIKWVSMQLIQLFRFDQIHRFPSFIQLRLPTPTSMFQFFSTLIPTQVVKIFPLPPSQTLYWEFETSAPFPRFLRELFFSSRTFKQHAIYIKQDHGWKDIRIVSKLLQETVSIFLTF